MRRYLQNSLEPEPTESGNPIARVKSALNLALKIENALFPVEGEQGAEINFQIRLARAQMLGAIDALTEVVRRSEAPRSVNRSGVCRAPVNSAEPIPQGESTASGGLAH